MFRKCLFWSHLVAGVVCGLVILMMSVTGVLLTYERQIIALAETAMHHTAATNDRPLETNSLLANLAQAEPNFEPSSVVLNVNSHAPLLIRAGRSGRRFVDRYTGELLPDSAAGTRGFFSLITRWHRWFDIEGDDRATARAVTGASNLAFLFLLFTGAYLWLPPVFNRIALRTRYLFSSRVANSKARDYNWHHVLGVWSVLPLIVIVSSALVFSYGWANTLLYRAVGDTPPDRRTANEKVVTQEVPVNQRPLDEYFAAAATAAPDWRTLTLTLPARADSDVQVSADYSIGGQPQNRVAIVLDATSSEVSSVESFDAQPAGRQARAVVRFLHTGEVLGFAGQTLAGLVSLTTIVMVWTGLALAWRRLIVPLLRRRDRLLTNT